VASPFARYGITIPFDGVPLHEHRRLVEMLEELGYTDVWSAEIDGADGFTPLALASTWAPSLKLGVAITPVFTRGPALIAQSIASMADAAPGRFVAGIGASSEVIVNQWNSIDFSDPYGRARDLLTFLKAALGGEKVDAEYKTFKVSGFRLSRIPEVRPPIFLAALRPGMLRLAGREADGAILNWLSAEDVKKAVAEVGQGPEIAARIFVIPNEDAEVARAAARRMIAAYLNVEAYARFQQWLGRGPLLQDMWDAWAAGDRRRALESIPDEVVDDLVVHGSAEDCLRQIGRYVSNGVTIPVLLVVPAGVDLVRALTLLAPGPYLGS